MHKYIISYRAEINFYERFEASYYKLPKLLADQLFDYVAMDVGQPEVAALISIS